jgi:hypothetical protein
VSAQNQGTGFFPERGVLKFLPRQANLAKNGNPMRDVNWCFDYQNVGGLNLRLQIAMGDKLIWTRQICSASNLKQVPLSKAVEAAEVPIRSYEAATFSKQPARPRTQY